jgi:hypothetical protein
MVSSRDTGAGTVASLRDAEAADHPAIREIIAAAYREYETVLPPGGFEIYLEDLLDLDGRAEVGSLIVAE